MKDKDFDEIGKRLHNLDADPPKDGWNRIITTLNSPSRPGRVVWLKKNWWKPLVILLPISFYIIYTEQGGKNLELSSSLSVDSAAGRAGLENATSGAIDSELLERSAPAVKHGELAVKSKPNDEVRSETKTKVNPDKQNHVQRSTVQPPLPLENAGKSEVEGQAVTSGVIVSIPGSNGVANKDNGDSTVIQPSLNQEISRQGGKASDENTHAPAEQENPVTKDASGEAENIVSEINGVAMDSQNSANNRSRDAADSSVDPSGSPAETEKTKIEKDATEKEMAASASEIVVEEEKSKYEQWRITALVAPQFSTRAPKPVANDDVLVTEIESSGHPENIGFGIAIGAGRSITPHFYIDGQGSFMQTKFDTYFSSATGNVDTLIAVQQPDQSVLVRPVYQVNNREISSEYRYAGITLGGTYYFWSTPRRRFNISANVGAQYLVQAQLREKIDGQWWTLSTENVNKMNYTVMIAAGYNIKMNQGWELTINPSLMYYLKETLSGDLPYNLNQGVFGLNIMLSKTLGRMQ